MACQGDPFADVDRAANKRSSAAVQRCSSAVRVAQVCTSTHCVVHASGSRSVELAGLGQALLWKVCLGWAL